MASLLGARLGEFTVEEELGRGATSIVYRVRNDANVVRAAKVFKQHLFESGSRLREEGIERECRIRERAVHPNVCQLFGWYRQRIGDERVRYLISEFVDGTSLEREIRRGGPLLVGTFLTVARQIAAGLMAMHEAGPLHRDIKTGNVLLESATGRAVVADFGVIRDLTAATTETSGTDFKGTWHYASPEAIERSSAADQLPSDVYSLGATFYEMLTGARPFAEIGPLTRLADAIRSDPLPMVATAYPPRIVQLVRLMLAKSPEIRPTLAEVLEVLDRDDDSLVPSTSRGMDADPLAALRTRLASDTGLAQERRSAQRHMQRVRARERISADVGNYLHSWSHIMRLDQLPGATVGIVQGVVENARSLDQTFPDRDWTGTIMISVAAPGMKPTAIVYVHDGLPDTCRPIRFFARGSGGLTLAMETAEELPSAPPSDASGLLVEDLLAIGPRFLTFLAQENESAQE